MRDWLMIQFEKGNDIRLKEFIQANPVLDMTMRTLLANYLDLSEPNVQRWIEDYQRKGSEYLQSRTNHVHSVHRFANNRKMPTTFNVSKAFKLSRTICILHIAHYKGYVNEGHLM